MPTLDLIPTERHVTETFHCRGTELSTLLAHIREERAVLLCLSIECQSDFTLTVNLKENPPRCREANQRRNGNHDEKPTSR